MTSDKQERFISSLVTCHCFHSSTDEVNYLDAISFFEDDLLPVGSSNHPLVEFNRQAFRRKREMMYQLSDGERSKHVARFAVYFYKQVYFGFLSTSSLMNHTAQFCSFALDGRADEYCRAPRFKVWQHGVENQGSIASGLP